MNSPDRKNLLLRDVARKLCSSKIWASSIEDCIHPPMPSSERLKELIEDLRSVLFPGYFGHSDLNHVSIEYYIGAKLDKIYANLLKQIKRGFVFMEYESMGRLESDFSEISSKYSEEFIKRLPYIREMLLTDAKAAYEGDPASRSIGETIFSYPSLRALTNYRVAHELYVFDIPIIPRIISELAHSETGIDIHPGAKIDESFFIDHGTGVVIGETAVIGKNVRLYQGVTLGAKSFPLDKDGNPIKGIDRHPVVGDNVVIYSGATILGRITIGAGSVIGGNVWVTEDIEPGARVLQGKK